MSEAAVVTPKKAVAGASKKTSAKKPAVSPAHPSVAEMINTALAALKDRKGTSLQAIKKYIADNYNCYVDRLAPRIKKYLKSAVEKNTIIQTKGTGASGRFKLGQAEKKKASPKKPSPKKPVVVAKKAAPKKSTGKKKDVAAKPKPTEKKEKAAKKPSAAEKAKAPKSPSKAKKVGMKSPVAAKPKTPKPKKAVSIKAKPAKK